MRGPSDAGEVRDESRSCGPEAGASSLLAGFRRLSVRRGAIIFSTGIGVGQWASNAIGFSFANALSVAFVAGPSA